MLPVAVLQGGREVLMAGSTELCRAVVPRGGVHEYVAVQGAPHGMENWEGHPEWDFTKQKVVDCLKSTCAFEEDADGTVHSWNHRDPGDLPDRRSDFQHAMPAQSRGSAVATATISSLAREPMCRTLPG